MDQGRPTERMQKLIAAVQQAIAELEAGRLNAEGLEQATDYARAIYERLVVLRHKAREAGIAQPPAVADPPPPAVSAPLRLDTRPAEPPIRQTSLIDAIAETETPPAKAAPVPKAPKQVEPKAQEPVKPVATKARPAEAPKNNAKTASLADKLEHAPIADLHKAIALSQKFWFVAELFAGQRERYEKTIDGINAAKSMEEARALLDREVIAKQAKPPEEALRSFIELLERRFK